MIANRAFWACLSFPLAIAAQTHSSHAEDALLCTRTDGMIPGPLVSDKVAARKIFEAISENLQDTKKYRDIRVSDEGATWVVVGFEQAPRPVPPPKGYESVEITTGGGGLTLRIDKCTGAVTEAYYAR